VIDRALSSSPDDTGHRARRRNPGRSPELILSSVIAKGRPTRFYGPPLTGVEVPMELVNVTVTD
jgi:hypothetical protein